MKLQNLNLVELNAQEAIAINGGGRGKGGIWAWLAEEIIDNWGEIKKGVSDGWNGKYNPPK